MLLLLYYSTAVDEVRNIPCSKCGLHTLYTPSVPTTDTEPIWRTSFLKMVYVPALENAQSPNVFHGN